MIEADKKAFDTVKKLFKNDQGMPFEMTNGQIKLFRAIYEKQNPRIQVECYTQYGKSDIVSMAVLLRATTFPEKWAILGGTADKAKIIMSKVIKHIFENDYTLGKFQIGKDESLERIKRERSKERITFKVDDKNLGEVFILSADARKKGEDAGDILIGHGSPNLVEDDAALIPDAIHGKAMRMLGGHKDNFLLKVTNTFGRNHAFRSSNELTYKKIFVDYQQGIAEGRITEEYIAEMRSLLDPIMFGILYKCEYPPADMVDEQGWMALLTEEDIMAAQQRVLQSIGEKRLGADISEGVNFNAFVIRTDNIAKILKKTLEKDLMKTAEEIAKIGKKDEYINGENIFVDAIGVGAGVVSRLNELKIFVNGIKSGEKPTETRGLIEFYNLRAQLYWNLKQWLLQGGALEPHKDWLQLTKIRYKEDVGRRIKIMSKEEMRMKGLILATESPDVADALALTFATSKVINYELKASIPVLPYYPELGI